MSQSDRTTGLVGYSGVKVPVMVASTAALTLSGEQTIDGVACVTGDRVLVKDQASSVDNGIYVVDTGDWNRATDCDGPYDLRSGSLVVVYAGTTNGGAVFRLTTAGQSIDIGTDALTFVSMGLLSVPVSVASGGTGATSKISALSNLGLVQVTAEAGTNTITGTVDALVTALRADQIFILVPAGANTGATTAEFTPSGGSSLGAKNVFANGAACVGGELATGVPVLLQYDGTQFNIINPQVAAVTTVPTGATFSYIGTTAPAGYVLLDGKTIGNATSGGTERANADTEDLYTLLWNSMADAQAPVSTGRGASAAADFAASKTITLPDARGRAIFGKDNMGGTAANRVTNANSAITATTLGVSGGDERLYQHLHAVSITTGAETGHTHAAGTYTYGIANPGAGAGNASAVGDSAVATANVAVAGNSGASTGHTHPVSGNTANTGGNTTSQNMPPALVLNMIIKL